MAMGYIICQKITEIVLMVNKEILDDVAMYGDVDFLEDYYGKINLENYERFLQDTSQVLANNRYNYKSREKEEEAYQLVRSLNRNKFLL